MVERLKIAIAKARERRANAGAGMSVQAAAPAQAGAAIASAPTTTATATAVAAQPKPAIDTAKRDANWEALRPVALDLDLLAQERIVTAQKSDPAHVSFDMLRTRLTKVMQAEGWRRIGITSPTKGCGKTVVSANLGFSFGRHPESHTILLDLDLRSPRLSNILGRRDRLDLTQLLDGTVKPENYLKRVAPRFALVLNNRRVRDSAEFLQNTATLDAFERMSDAFNPDIEIYDLPPMLVGDDAVAFLPFLDAVIMVAAAGQTTPQEIEECEALISDQTTFLGVIMNKLSRPGSGSYYYYYSYSYGYGYGYGYDDDSKG
ncbi:MAG: CpsD/CapB family tyrosine-protein kinase [Pseudomonadota bacterium]